MLQYLVFVGVAVGALATLAYIRDTLTGKTKPNRITWLMWSAAPLIAAFAGLAKGVTLAVLPVFMAGFCPLLVLLASFANRNAYWKLEKFDYFCGFFSVLALILWGITKEPNIAIVFAIASDGSAALPTLLKAWRHPETETGFAYTSGIFSAFTAFAAVKFWSFAEIAFPIYLVVANSLLSFAVYRQRIFKR